MTAPDPASVDTDKLPVQQYLVLEVLAARYRTGETAWTFPSRVRWALLHLAEMGLVNYKSGVEPRTYLAWLTEAGRAAALSPTYKPPAGGTARTEWAVYWHGSDGDGIRYDELHFSSREDAERRGPQMIGIHGITRWSLHRRTHSTYPDGSTLVGPWQPVPTDHPTTP